MRAALSRLIDDEREQRSYPFVPVLAEDVEDVRALPAFAQQYQGVFLREGPVALQRLIAAALALGATSTPALVRDPFVGLEAFGLEDAHLFFGRESHTREVLSRMHDSSPA